MEGYTDASLTWLAVSATGLFKGAGLAGWRDICGTPFVAEDVAPVLHAAWHYLSFGSGCEMATCALLSH